MEDSVLIPLLRERESLSCPQCTHDSRLEIALRLELEAESERIFATCADCSRLYEVTPDGSIRVAAGDLPELCVTWVACPRCQVEGSVLTWSMPEAHAEIYLLITCPACEHVFAPAPRP
jgi:transcription elongation factor Elf1